MGFNEKLNQYANIINNELEKYIRKEKCPEEILNSSVEYTLMGASKRIRSVLMIASYNLFRGDIETVFPFCVALEMIHNFSLIHDDLPGIDNDDFRRGKPTNHKKFNEYTAILAGDSLLNNAYMVICDCISKEKNKEMQDRKIRCFEEFSYATDRMIAGEFVDTEFEGKDISNEYLEYMHNNKTGALIKMAVRIGAILAGASKNELEALTNYANKVGLAFQIKDDILSEIGDEKILGKPVRK